MDSLLVGTLYVARGSCPFVVRLAEHNPATGLCRYTWDGGRGVTWTTEARFRAQFQLAPSSTRFADEV